MCELYICVHFIWFYNVSQRLGCYEFYTYLEDAGMIVRFRAILCII